MTWNKVGPGYWVIEQKIIFVIISERKIRGMASKIAPRGISILKYHKNIHYTVTFVSYGT